MPRSRVIISALKKDSQLYDFATALLAQVNYYAIVTPGGKATPDPNTFEESRKDKVFLRKKFKKLNISFKDDAAMITALRKIIPNADILRHYTFEQK